jgi:hypothetical protein
MTTNPPRLTLDRDPLWLRVSVAAFMLLYKVIPWHWIPTESAEPTVNLFETRP